MAAAAQPFVFLSSSSAGVSSFPSVLLHPLFPPTAALTVTQHSGHSFMNLPVCVFFYLSDVLLHMHDEVIPTHKPIQYQQELEECVVLV